jgi:transposase-like protein
VDGEVVIERRRHWTPEQKAALLAEVEAEGGQVSVVARRHGISNSLLYNWRSAWKAAAARGTAIQPTEFVQSYVRLWSIAPLAARHTVVVEHRQTSLGAPPKLACSN